jgi:hypothetical protein
LKRVHGSEEEEEEEEEEVFNTWFALAMGSEILTEHGSPCGLDVS